MEIIPKGDREKKTSIQDMLFYIGLGLLLLSIMVSAGFLAMNWLLSGDLLGIRDEINRKKQNPEIIELKSSINIHHKVTSDFSYILQKRTSVLPFFSALESVLHPGVYLSDIKISVADKRISASGIAENIIAYDQQVRIFNNSPIIISAEVANFTIGGDGSVSFPISIVLSSKLFN